MNFLEKLGLLLIMIVITGFMQYYVIFNMILGLLLFFFGGFIEHIFSELDKIPTDPKGGM